MYMQSFTLSNHSFIHRYKTRKAYNLVASIEAMQIGHNSLICRIHSLINQVKRKNKRRLNEIREMRG